MIERKKVQEVAISFLMGFCVVLRQCDTDFFNKSENKSIDPYPKICSYFRRSLNYQFQYR